MVLTLGESHILYKRDGPLLIKCFSPLFIPNHNSHTLVNPLRRITLADRLYLILVYYNYYLPLI